MYNMKIYECECCGKTFDRKSNYINHKNRKNPCNKTLSLLKNTEFTDVKKKINNKIMKKFLDKCECVYCNAKFSRKDSVIYHIKNNCKKVKEIEKEEEEEQTIFTKLKKLEEENQKLKEKIDQNSKEFIKKIQIEVRKEIDKIETNLVQSEIKKDLGKKLFSADNRVNDIIGVIFNKDINSNDKKKYIKKKIPKPLRMAVWNKYVGENIGKSLCLCCELNYITMFDFVCGHIVAESQGGSTTLDNLVPICTHCNESMYVENLHKFKNDFFPVKQKKKPEMSIKSTCDKKVQNFFKELDGSLVKNISDKKMKKETNSNDSDYSYSSVDDSSDSDINAPIKDQ